MAAEKEMSFLDHLEELRWHLIRIISAVLIMGAVAFVAKSFVFDVLIFGPKRADFFTYRALCDLSKWLRIEEGICFEKNLNNA